MNLMIIVMGFLGARYLALLLRLPKGVIASFIVLFSIFGAYAVNNTLFDVWVMLGSAVLAVGFRLAGLPILPAVLAFILGGLLESNVAIAAARASGIEYFFGRPIATGLCIASLLLIGWTGWRRMPLRTGRHGSGRSSAKTGDNM